MDWMNPPGGQPWALIGLAGASLLLNVALGARLATLPGPGDTVAVEMAASAPTAAPSAAPDAATSPDDAALAEVPTAPNGADPAAQADGLTASLDVATDAALLPPNALPVRAEVSRSLAYTFQQAVQPDHADVVSAVYARLFFWDLDLRRDLQKGDVVEAVYFWDGELAHIPVAAYDSKKLGKRLTAYRFQATGDAFSSYWDADGREVPHRLENGPLADYEQVTALLKDRPSHKGMDFKTPVGTPLVSPKAGTVLRTDWNLRFNGNCIELRYTDGTIAKFLHLSQVDVKPGQRVAAGTRIGETGNTGRSTAPHLHYELARNDRVVDPVDYHGTYRRQLPEADRARFAAAVRRLDAQLTAVARD